MQKYAGILITIGSLLWLAVFFPVMMIVFGTGDIQMRIQAISNDTTGWILSNLLIGVGGVVAAVGLVLFANHVNQINDNRNVGLAAYVAAGLILIGSLFYAYATITRINGTPEQIIDNLGNSTWYRPIPLLVQAGLILTGYVLLRSGYPKWLGWYILLMGILTMAAWLMMGDMPPAVYYIPILIVMGITLLFARSPQPTDQPEQAVQV